MRNPVDEKDELVEQLAMVNERKQDIDLLDRELQRVFELRPSPA